MEIKQMDTVNAGYLSYCISKITMNTVKNTKLQNFEKENFDNSFYCF